MVFKRRDPRTWWQTITQALWPRGGWGRAIQYIRLRIRRLPDSPDRIARGIFSGVLVTFTPLYGFHFFVAFFLAKLMRGNVLAALLSTFVGNPVTFPFIAAGSIGLGNWLLGIEEPIRINKKFWSSVGAPFRESWQNTTALFTGDPVSWMGTIHFYNEIFFPYLIGGLIPGVILSTGAYFASEPVIRSYQQRRKGRLARKFRELTMAKAKAKSTPTRKDQADA